MIALREKVNDICPIAVAEVFRHLASHLCCAAVRSELPNIFLPYGQVGVGVKGAWRLPFMLLDLSLKSIVKTRISAC